MWPERPVLAPMEISILEPSLVRHPRSFYPLNNNFFLLECSQIIVIQGIFLSTPYLSDITESNPQTLKSLLCTVLNILAVQRRHDSNLYYQHSVWTQVYQHRENPYSRLTSTSWSLYLTARVHFGETWVRSRPRSVPLVPEGLDKLQLKVDA